MMYEMFMMKAARADWGYDFEARPDLHGWDITLMFGIFHIVISHTSGTI